MKREMITPIVTKKWIKWRLVLLAALVGVVFASVVTVITLRDVRSRALVLNPSPSPLISTPVFKLSPPFIALTSTQSTYSFGETVPIDVYIHTKSQETMAAELVISFNPEILTIIEEELEIADVYKSVSVESSDSGKLLVSFFITPQVGHQPVKLATPTKIGTLNFKTQALTKEKTEINLDFDPEDNESTRLVPFSEDRPEVTANILETVSGTKITIAP